MSIKSQEKIFIQLFLTSIFIITETLKAAHQDQWVDTQRKIVYTCGANSPCKSVRPGSFVKRLS